MSNFLYSHPIDNVAQFAAVTVETGSAELGYEAENLVDLTDANIGRPALANTAGSIAYQLDFGAPIPIGAIMLWSNADAALDVRFQGNASASWGAPSLNAAITIPGVREDGYFVRPYKDLHDEAGYASYQYYRLLFAANSVPIGAKLLCFYGFRNLDVNFDWNFREPEFRGSIQMETDGGARWAYDQQLAAGGFQGTCEWATDGDRAKLQALWRAAGGTVKPFVFILDPDINDARLVRFSHGSSPGRVTSAGPVIPSLEPTRKHFKMSKIALSLDEVTAGGPEWL